MMTWQLRSPYFHGPDRYKIELPDGSIYEIEADKNGRFQIDKVPENVPLGVFAKCLTGCT